MHVAVIGGTRHVGPFIVRELVRSGHQVSVFNRGRTPVDLPHGVQRVTVDREIRGRLGEALRRLRPDAVIDMIGFVAADVEEVADALPSLQHYVFCSSTAVYGVIGSHTPDESAPVDPDSVYTDGKVACEELLKKRQRERDFQFTSLRLAHPYGPGDHLLYVTGRESLFLDRMRTGRTVLIPGRGRSRLHAIYAKDAARAFVHVLGRPECTGQVYNLADHRILTMDEYFESIARVLGVPLAAQRVDHAWFRDHAALWSNWRRKFDFGYNWVHYESAFSVRALEATGFRCRTDHDAGVALTMEWLDAGGRVDPSSDDDEEDRILRELGIED